MDLDTPARIEPHGPAIIYGVESEEVEEINDAYNDMLEDLGLSKATEVEFQCRPTFSKLLYNKCVFMCIVLHFEIGLCVANVRTNQRPRLSA